MLLYKFEVDEHQYVIVQCEVLVIVNRRFRNDDKLVM